MKSTLKIKLLVTATMIMTSQGAFAVGAATGPGAAPTPPPVVPDYVSLDQTLAGSNVGLKSFNQTVINNADASRVVNTTITTGSNVSKLYLSSADAGAHDTLTYVQPGSKSVVLNYITSGKPTNFAGTLNSNGRLVFINNAGLTFSEGSVLNVGALTATTAKNVALNGAGTYSFSDFSDASVNVNGTINAPKGFVNVLAKEINVGANANITANEGTINLSAGSKSYNVDLTGTGKVVYSATNLDKGAVTVLGHLNSGSGDVVIRARSTDIASSVINLHGVVDTAHGLTGTDDGSLTLQSTGNIDMTNSSYNAINTANDHVTTGTLTATAGNNLTASGEFNTGAIDFDATKGTTSLSGVYHAGKTISITSGNETNLLGDIRTFGGNIAVSSGKAVHLDAGINTRGATTSGNVSIASADGSITGLGSIDTRSNIGKGGSIALSTGTATKPTDLNKDILLSGDLISQGKTAGGAVTINSKGATTLGKIDSSGYSGVGGAVTVLSKGDLTTNGRISTSSILSNAGDVKLTSSAGAIHENGGVVTDSASGNAGDITLAAANNVDINGLLFADSYGAIQTNGKFKQGLGGNVTATSTTGDMTVNTTIYTGGSTAGAINLSAKKGTFKSDGFAFYNATGTNYGGKVTINGGMTASEVGATFDKVVSDGDKKSGAITVIGSNSKLSSL